MVARRHSSRIIVSNAVLYLTQYLILDYETEIVRKIYPSNHLKSSSGQQQPQITAPGKATRLPVPHFCRL